MAETQQRVEFTREMKKEYTIITPNMAPIHFELIKNVLESFGYKIDLLHTTGREIVDEGLKYVHNDTCYPALLSIGQMMPKDIAPTIAKLRDVPFPREWEGTSLC